MMENETFLGYGGPAFNPNEFQSAYQNREYISYTKLYDDVQLELDNLAPQIRSAFKCDPKELIWFEDSLDPSKYTSGLTVESCWQEDQRDGIDYFSNLVEHLEYVEGGEPFDPAELAEIDKSTMKCITDLMYEYDYENIRDDEYDQWGPFDWHPDLGEWSRCRDIAHDHQEYPVTVLANGKMIDGAHRLAVAVFRRERSYPCLVGLPYTWVERPPRKR